MRAALIAGALYFAIAFAAGFALGTLRVLVLIPAFGEMAAVLAEIPVILTISWAAARWIVSRRPALNGAGRRLVMGGSAFALLMAAELLLSATLFGRAPAAFAAQLLTPPGLTGLAGQIAFGLLPWLLWQIRRQTTTTSSGGKPLNPTDE